MLGFPLYQYSLYINFHLFTHCPDNINTNRLSKRSLSRLYQHKSPFKKSLPRLYQHKSPFQKIIAPIISAQVALPKDHLLYPLSKRSLPRLYQHKFHLQKIITPVISTQTPSHKDYWTDYINTNPLSKWSWEANSASIFYFQHKLLELVMMEI